MDRKSENAKLTPGGGSPWPPKTTGFGRAVAFRSRVTWPADTRGVREAADKGLSGHQLRGPRTLGGRPSRSDGVSAGAVPSGALDHALGYPERLRASRPLERARPVDHLHAVRRWRPGSALCRLHLVRCRNTRLLDSGGQTILLPPEVNVAIKGHGVMGGFDHRAEGTGTPGAPTVTIKGFSCGAESA